MFGKNMLCFVFVAVGFLVTRGDGYASRGTNEVYNEQPCLSQGGICVRENDCPEGSLVETKGLCPAQQKSGVECCYGLPKSEKRCGARGGECKSRTSFCADNLIFKQATDCAPDQYCCILVG